MWRFSGGAGTIDADVPGLFVGSPRTDCVGLFPGGEGVNRSGGLTVLGAFVG